MERYIEIINFIGNKQSWIDDNDFTFDAITKATMQLFNYCYAQIENYNCLQIVPNLRIIQENIVLLFGIHENTWDISDLLDKKINAKNIFNKIRENQTEQELYKIETVSTFLKKIKDYLNEFSHTSPNGFLQLALDEYQTPLTRKINKASIGVLAKLLEAFFLEAVNFHYKTFMRTDTRSIFNDIIQVRTFARPKIPDTIEKFLKTSPFYKNHLTHEKELFNDIRKMVEEFGQRYDKLT